MKHCFLASTPKRQGGVVLFIALIVLVAMTLAAIALVRSTDTGNLIAGNIAFRQGALQESDLGVEAAFNAIATGVIASTSTTSSPQYYAVMQALGSNNAPTPINAMTTSDAVNATDVYAAGAGPNGNRVRYVIERMCNNVVATGLPPTTNAEIQANCLTYTPSSGSNSSRNAGRVKLTTINTTSVYYRVTVRVDGPHNTVSIAQALIRV